MSVVRIKKTENYVVLSKQALENPKLSLKAKGLWAYCMGKPDNWEFHLIQLQKTFIEGRRAISGAIEELIQQGYCIRIQNKDENGRWTTVDYEIFETSQLKESLPESRFVRAENALAQNVHLLSNEEETKDRKEISHKASACASALAQFFLEKIKEKKQSFKPQAFTKWALEFDLMMNKDGRTEERIKQVIEYLTSDISKLRWVLSAKKLRSQFDALEFDLEASSLKNRANTNREYARKMKDQYPEQMRALSFDSKYAKNISTLKDVPFDLPPETFKDALLSMFGGSRE
jgi:hypothetical protein